MVSGRFGSVEKFGKSVVRRVYCLSGQRGEFGWMVKSVQNLVGLRVKNLPV
jgi:hypothetical protein